MRRRRAVLVVLALSVLSAAFAAPALAGGPTSVLLADPGSGTTASLYHDDPDYSALAGLVGAAHGSGVAGTIDRSGATHQIGAGITLTWLAPDVTVWRLDRVHLSANGGPWISTQVMSGESGSIWDRPVVWHRPADGKALAALLERLGVGTGAGTGVGTGTGSGGVEGSEIFGEAQPAPVAQGSAADTAAGSSTSSAAWVWGLTGVLLGIALALGAPRMLSTIRRARSAGQRTTTAQGSALPHAGSPEKTDLPDDDLAWTARDELSWAGGPDLARRG